MRTLLLEKTLDAPQKAIPSGPDEQSIPMGGACFEACARHRAVPPQPRSGRTEQNNKDNSDHTSKSSRRFEAA